MKTTNETKQSICTLVQRSRHNPWSALGCGVLTPSSSSPGSLRTQYAWSQRHHDPITSSFQPINCVIKCLTLTMFSVTSSSSSSRPSTDLLSSLAALASAGLVSAGGPATVKGKKSNQQQSDHLICEVTQCSKHFSSPVLTYFLITRVAVEVYFLITRVFFLQVCGERAGKHSYYGGQVCPSCRAFFRRSVQSR